MKKIHLKPICCNLCMLWGRCIYNDQHAFTAILSIDKEPFLHSTTRIQFRRHECKIRHWFGTVGWFVQLLGGTFRQESDYPTFISFGSP